jgi:hypothetical protein
MVRSYQPVTPPIFVGLSVLSVFATFLVLWAVAAMGDHVFVQEERAAIPAQSAVAVRALPAHLAQAARAQRG